MGPSLVGESWGVVRARFERKRGEAEERLIKAGVCDQGRIAEDRYSV